MVQQNRASHHNRVHDQLVRLGRLAEGEEEGIWQGPKRAERRREDEGHEEEEDKEGKKT
jgi:hypothetical protein